MDEPIPIWAFLFIPNAQEAAINLSDLDTKDRPNYGYLRHAKDPSGVGLLDLDDSISGHRDLLP